MNTYLSENWKLILDHFDMTFMITLSHRRNDRGNNLAHQITGIDQATDRDLMNCGVHVLYATEFPHNKLITTAFNRSDLGHFAAPNEYDCSRNHYTAIKAAYDLNCNSVLVLEDDVAIIRDVSVVDSFMSHLPADWDILRLGGFSVNPDIFEYLVSEPIWHQSHFELWMTSGYALNRTGMKYYLDFMDHFFSVAPFPFIKLCDSEVVQYFPSIPIITQGDRKFTKSDISKNQIKYNLYEYNVNYNDYAEYIY